MNEMMPKEDYEFIKNIQNYMLDSTNMKADDAWSFAFSVWQNKKWLTNFLLNDTRNDIAYQQGRADAIQEFYNRLSRNRSAINTSNYPWNYVEVVYREMNGMV